jgi:glutathione synthase/RimK-type ligase-like ATP-grasp enzyme
MIRNLCVVENVRHWRKKVPGLDFVSPTEYLFGQEFQDLRQLRVINLARNYGYLGGGYYVSLVAEARGHKVIPKLSALQALSKKELYLIEADDLAAQIQKDLAPLSDNHFELSVYFGHNVSKKYEKLSRMFFHLFPCPAFRVFFSREKKWSITSIKPLSLDKIQDSHQEDFLEALVAYSVERWGVRKNTPARYELAILFNPEERWAPSNAVAIQKFVKAGKAEGLSVEVIGKRDYASLAQFDGLFIRETTSIDHHTYRFAKKAEKEGMVIIDDPKSILYCTNKIFLYELFKRSGINRPKTVVFGEEHLPVITDALAFPIVIKIPDGTFSRGIEKVEDPGRLESVCREFFRHSDYLVAQEFMPTPFDWRIGVFDGKPLFACQYFMSRNHWQIYDHSAQGKAVEGAHKTHPVEDVDPRVIAMALRAARLIGDGLYGVDIKVVKGRSYVIEVNDNPNIDAGVEDDILKDRLYHTIMREFSARIERVKMRKTALPPPSVAATMSSIHLASSITHALSDLTTSR